MAATPTPVSAYLTESERTFTTPRDYYRLRDFGQKFEAAIAYMRRHGLNMYRVLLLPLLLSALPLVLLAAAALAMSQQLAEWTGGFDPKNPFDTLAAVLPLVGLLLLGLGLIMGVMYAMLFGFMKCRMAQPDPAVKLSTAEVWQVARGYVLPLLGYFFVTSVLSVVGWFLFLIPGVYLFVVFLLLPNVLVFEDQGFGRNFGRSFSLIRGKWWSTFGLYVIGAMILGMLSFMVNMVVMVVMVPLSLVADPTLVTVVTAISQFLMMALQFLLFPLVSVLLLFQYFNLVERRDHVSLQWRVEELGQTPAAAQPNAAAPDDSLFRPSYGDPTH